MDIKTFFGRPSYYEVLKFLFAQNQPVSKALVTKETKISYCHSYMIIRDLETHGLTLSEAKNGRAFNISITDKGIKVFNLLDNIRKELENQPIKEPLKIPTSDNRKNGYQNRKQQSNDSLRRDNKKQKTRGVGNKGHRVTRLIDVRSETLKSHRSGDKNGKHKRTSKKHKSI